MCILTYLQEEATVKITFVIGKIRGAPIRHTTIPKLELQAAVYGGRLRRQILRENNVTIDKIYHWQIHLQCYSGHSRLTRKNKCSLPTGQLKYWKILPEINGDVQTELTTMQILAQDECPSLASRSPLGETGRQGSRQMKKCQSSGAKWTKLKLSKLPVL